MTPTTATVPAAEAAVCNACGWEGTDLDSAGICPTCGQDEVNFFVPGREADR